ncbi:MAG: hypothetical protein GY716_17135 [bacterium]|nr:hypothetical protein [bacterium]
MKKTTLAIALLLLTGLLLPASASTYEEAKAAFESGDYEQAAAKFRDLTEQNPTWAPGYVTLAQCHYLMGQAKRGEEAMGLALEVDPETDVFAAYSGVGQLLYNKKDYATAVPALQRATESAPDTSLEQTRLKLGYAQFMAKQYDGARVTLGEHAQQAGFDADPSYYLAIACQRTGDYDCALDNLRQLDEAGVEGARAQKIAQYLAQWSHYWALSPRNKARRGQLLAAAADDTRAWFEFERDNPEAVETYARTLLAAGRESDLVDTLTPVAEAHPEQCVTHTLLAKASNELDRHSTAETWAGRAIECSPKDPDAHVELAVARLTRLRAEHSTVDEVQRDVELTRNALASVERALQLDDEAGKRATSLKSQLQSTLARLQQAERAISANDAAYDAAVAAADLEQEAERCRTIYWAKRDESRDLSTDDEEFYRARDCGRYVARERSEGISDDVTQD